MQLVFCVRLLICLILRLATAAVAAAALVATLPQPATPFQFQCERLSSLVLCTLCLSQPTLYFSLTLSLAVANLATAVDHF